MTNLATNLALNPVAISSPSSGSPVADLLRLLGVGCVLLAAVWAALAWLRSRAWFQKTLEEKVRLRILESRSLPNRSAIHLVACGHQRFLLGVSAAGVSMLTELDSEGGSTSPTFAAVIAAEGKSAASPSLGATS